MKRVFLHVINRQLSAAFRIWLTDVRENKRVEVIMKKIKSRWTHGIALKAYNSWVSYVEEIKHHRHVVQMVKSRMSNIILYKSWVTWKNYADTVKSQRSKIIRFISKIPLRLQSIGFQRWHLIVLRDKERERQVQTVYKCLSQLLNHNASIAFNTWNMHTKWHRKADRNTKKIIKRWKQIELNAAFQTYKSNVKSILKDKALLKRATARIKYMKLHSCINAWVSFVDERCRVRRCLISYFKKQSYESKSKRLNRGWNIWCRYVSKSKLHEMSSENIEKELKRQQQLRKRVFLHVINRQLSAAFRI